MDEQAEQPEGAEKGIPRVGLIAQGTVTYPPEMGIPSQEITLRAGIQSDDPAVQRALVHSAKHSDAKTECPGEECPLLIEQ